MLFFRQCKNQTEPLNMIQNVFQNDFMNFNGSLMGLRREKWIFEGLWHVRAGKDHQDPKIGRKYWKRTKLVNFGRTLITITTKMIFKTSDWHPLIWKIIRYKYSELSKKKNSGLRLLQVPLIFLWKKSLRFSWNFNNFKKKC